VAFIKFLHIAVRQKPRWNDWPHAGNPATAAPFLLTAERKIDSLCASATSKLPRFRHFLLRF
jgi:hypothetical protein